MEGMIEANRVWFKYDRRWIFRDLSIVIKDGLTLIMGPNGCGKTTLAKILSGLLMPQRGSILIDNINIYSGGYRAEEKLREVVYVHDRPVILRGTVYDNLLYGLNTLGIDDRGRLEELIDRFNLRGLLNTRSRELSAGQRQITSLVRAFATNPRYLILDEPLAYLDIDRRNMVIEYLRERKRDTNIIIATHEQTLLDLADNILVFIGEGIIRYRDEPYNL